MFMKAHVNRVSIGLVMCLVAALTVGCGTVTASQPVTGRGTTATGDTSQPPGTAVQGSAAAVQGSPAAIHGSPAAIPASRRPDGIGAPPGCQNAAPGGPILLITLASNGKAYCVRVGERVVVQLRSTLSSRWQPPVASSSVLRPIPSGALSFIEGLTEGWFAGARRGQAFITSVQPCRVLNEANGDLQPASSVPTSHPVRICAAEPRFSVMIVVVS
jgi:hypothetical protein